MLCAAFSMITRGILSAALDGAVQQLLARELQGKHLGSFVSV